MKKKFLLGSWITLSHPSIAEIFANCKEIDYIVIDLEHSVISLFEVENLIRIIKLKGKLAIVRLSGTDEKEIKKVLDSGADGIIVPMVNTMEDAQRAVDAVRYPPEGKRGVGLARAQGYGFDFKKYLNKQKNIEIVLQIEHIDAINNLESILAVEGINGTTKVYEYKDPFGTNYSYVRSTPSYNTASFDVYSNGPDEADNSYPYPGDLITDDITNW